MNETLTKNDILVPTLLIVGIIATIIFVPGAMEIYEDFVEGAMTALQDIVEVAMTALQDIGNAISKVIFK